MSEVPTMITNRRKSVNKSRKSVNKMPKQRPSDLPVIENENAELCSENLVIVKQYQRDSMCPEMENIIVRPSKKGKGGYGTAYTVSCSGSTDKFIIKWVEMDTGSNYTVMTNYDEDMEHQISLQNLAAKFDLSLPIYYKVECPITKEQGFMMPMADFTALSIMTRMENEYLSRSDIQERIHFILEDGLNFLHDAFRRYCSKSELGKYTYFFETLKKQLYQTEYTTVEEWQTLKREMRVNLFELITNLEAIENTTIDIEGVIDSSIGKEINLPITDTGMLKEIRHLRKKLETKIVELHEIGIVHRDAHLDNFMWWKGEWYFIDFGLAIYIEDADKYEIERDGEDMRLQLNGNIRIR